MDAPPLYPQSEKRKVKLPVFTFAELISATLRLYGENFARFVLPVALVAVPSVVITITYNEWLASNSALTRMLIPSAGRMTPEEARQILNEAGGFLTASSLFNIVLALLQSLIIGSMVTWLTSESYLGRTSSTRQALRVAINRALPLTGGYLMVWGFVFLLTVGLTLALFLCGLGVGLLIYVIVGLTLLIQPVLVLERVGVGKGVRRCWSLSKKRFWPLFGITVVTLIASIVPVFSFILFTGNPSPVANVIFQSILNIILIPVLPIAYTLIYYDARVRYEDLEGAMETALTPNPTPADVESPLFKAPLFEGSDFTNLGIMTALLFVVLLIAVGVGIATGGAMSPGLR